MLEQVATSSFPNIFLVHSSSDQAEPEFPLAAVPLDSEQLVCTNQCMSNLHLNADQHEGLWEPAQEADDSLCSNTPRRPKARHPTPHCCEHCH